MPIKIGKPVDPHKALLNELGNQRLRPHQAETMKKHLERGKAGYTQPVVSEFGKANSANHDLLPNLSSFSHGVWFAPGKGKTFYSLWYEKKVREFLVEQKDPRAELPTLIITPTSAKWQWASIEIPKWRPDAIDEVMVIDGDVAERQAQLRLFELIKPKIVVVHIAALSPQMTGVYDFLQSVHWLFLVCDEDQRYKNWSSIRTVRKNGIKREIVLSLTGTPQSGYPDKLHPLLHGIAPGKFISTPVIACQPGPSCPLSPATKGSFVLAESCEGCFNYRKASNDCTVQASRPGPNDYGVKFQYSPGRAFSTFKEFCDLYVGRDDEGKKAGAANAEHLHSLIYDRGYATRVLGDTKLGPPVKVGLQLSGSQKDLYNTIRQGLRKYFNDKLEEEQDRGSDFVLAMLTHLRRASTMSPTAFMLAYGNHPPSWATLDKFRQVGGESTKIEWLLDHIRDNVAESNDKVIVGTEWKDCLEEVTAKLDADGWQNARVKVSVNGIHMEYHLDEVPGRDKYYIVIDGSVDPKERTALQQLFNTDKRVKGCIMTSAGYAAINLTGGLKGEETMHIVTLGVPWLPDDLTQLFGRADREDMEGCITTYIPYCIRSVDEYVHSVLYGKQLAADQIIDGKFDGEGSAENFGLAVMRMLDEVLGDQYSG